MNEVFICSPVRTPIGSFLGVLQSCTAPVLGRTVVAEVIQRSGVSVNSVGEVIMGCVLTAGLGQAPTRQVVRGAGLPDTVQAMTVNKVCSSGLTAVMLAARNIRLGLFDCAIAGGMESMSNAPFLLQKHRPGAKLGHDQVLDSIITDGLWDPYNNFHMGNAAELCAAEKHLSRADQDTFALESYRRATAAIYSGIFKDEIVPVEIDNGREKIAVTDDEEPLRLKSEKVPTLKPVFKKEGTVTAANASSINDGAAAMLLCSERFLKEHSLTPVLRLVSEGWYGQSPEWFTTAPVGAVKMALSRAKKKVTDIDSFEINEAFAAVALACQHELTIDTNKLNIYGGAVALGHPIGASGARIVVTLNTALMRTGGKLGVAAICNGGGEATAVVVERV